MEANQESSVMDPHPNDRTQEDPDTQDMRGGSSGSGRQFVHVELR